MKKITAIVLSMVCASIAQAKIEGKYSLKSSDLSEGSSLCSSTLVISKLATDTLKVEGARDLGSYYNLDGAEGAVIISGINRGKQVSESKNSSHGEKYSTTNLAAQEGDVLKLTSNSKTKAFGVTLDESLNELMIEVKSNTLMLSLKRSHKVRFDGQGNWSAEENCTYSK